MADSAPQFGKGTVYHAAIAAAHLMNRNVPCIRSYRVRKEGAVLNSLFTHDAGNDNRGIVSGAAITAPRGRSGASLTCELNWVDVPTVLAHGSSIQEGDSGGQDHGCAAGENSTFVLFWTL
jgi:hypothetical protein